MLGGQPHLTGLFEHLFALRVNAGIQCGDSSGLSRTLHGSVQQLGIQGLEGLHDDLSSQTDEAVLASAPGLRTVRAVEPEQVEPQQSADGGVIARLRRRNQLAGSSAALLAAALGILTVLWSGSANAAGTVLTVVLTLLLIALAGRYFRIAALWAGADGILQAGASSKGVVGQGVPLHPVRRGQPVRRRVPTSVVPVRTDGGPLASGAGLVVHGRDDGVQLEDSDAVTVWQVAGRPRSGGGAPDAVPSEASVTLVKSPGPVSPRTASPKGLFLIRRDSDGAEFAAGTGVMSVI